ncbi:hypothetical protein SAMN05880561_101200 [Rhizobium sp. RU33A]|nr:hypothetical protein SAMN05880561_101200 [Rhizobium sp. RU33A]
MSGIIDILNSQVVRHVSLSRTPIPCIRSALLTALVHKGRFA